MLWGGIIAGTGGVISFTGLLMFALGSETSDDVPPKTGLRNAGIGVCVVGLATAITGGLIARKGRMERSGRYTFHLASPKRNEIGIACSF